MHGQTVADCRDFCLVSTKFSWYGLDVEAGGAGAICRASLYTESWCAR